VAEQAENRARPQRPLRSTDTFAVGRRRGRSTFGRDCRLGPSAGADNFRSLLSVADVCGDDWPQRAREALVTLIREIADDQPKAIILRHGLLLFQRLEADVLEIGLFNRELHKLDEPGFDWNRYCSPTGFNRGEHPISVSEQSQKEGPRFARPSIAVSDLEMRLRPPPFAGASCDNRANRTRRSPRASTPKSKAQAPSCLPSRSWSRSR
jgi:Protein of unknown function (DUF3631)